MSELGPKEMLLETAARLQERIATCHEVVDCPRCHALIGERCRRVRGYRTPPPSEPLKHPHRERWTRVVPER